MKYLLAFLVFLAIMVPVTARSGDEPEFHYGDCVKVMRGFYSGCHGRIGGYSGNNDYEITLSCPHGGGVVATLKSSEFKVQPQGICRDQ
jgi:hypothetical protein